MMNVHIRFSEVSSSLVENEFIQRRLEYALSANQAEIARVDVWILGIERADGGQLKFCKVNVILSDGKMVSSDSTEGDLHIAIHRAADRVGWEVARSIGRQHRERVNRAYSPAQRGSASRESEYLTGAV